MAQRLEHIDGRNIPDVADELRAVMVTRNEILRLPSAIAHYRKLGVERFFIVDNGSTDGTLDFLLSQSDVHIFSTESSYAESGHGLGWIDAILGAFGVGHWMLTVDADELLVYPHYERVPLRELCRFLDQTGARALFALLLDMYSDKPLPQTVHRPGDSLIETCAFFDPGPYRALPARAFPYVQIYGGVRERFFAWRNAGYHAPTVSKIPLVRWSEGLHYTLSTHAMTPTALSDLGGALLHFKFLSDFHERARVESARGEHFDNAREYRLYAEGLDSDPEMTLHYSESRRFAGSADLVDLKLMKTSPAYEEFVQRF